MSQRAPPACRGLRAVETKKDKLHHQYSAQQFLVFVLFPWYFVLKWHISLSLYASCTRSRPFTIRVAGQT